MGRKKKENSSYGQTVTVNYFVNDLLKPVPYFQQGHEVEAYPVYLRVIVKGQSIRRKSLIQAISPIDRLDTWLIENQDLVEAEKREIIIRVLDEKPFDSQSFDLKSIDLKLSFQDLLKDELVRVVGGYLLKEALKSFESGASHTFFLKKYDIFPDINAGYINPLDREEQLAEIGREARILCESLKCIGSERVYMFVKALSDLPYMSDLLSLYGSLWQLDRYCYQICFQSNRNFLKISDWKSGIFDELFKKYWPSEDLAALHISMDSLKLRHESLKILL